VISIKQSHIRHVTRRFWTFLLGTIIAFAVLVQIGRQAFLLVEDYRDVLAESLSDQLGVEVHIGAVEASWQGLRLELKLDEIEVFSDTGLEIFNIGSAEAELSLIDSIIERGLAWRTIQFERLSTTFSQQEDHTWKIKGYYGGTANTDNPFNFDDPLDVFLFGRRVEINSASLVFEFQSGNATELTIPSISLENDRFFHRMNANLNIDGVQALTFVVEGYGDPRNREKFSASGYLNIKDIALADVVTAVFDDDSSGSILPYVEKSLFNFEFWFRGSPEAGMTASGSVSIAELGASNVLAEDDSSAHEQFDIPNKVESSISGLWNSTFGWQLAFQKPQLTWSDRTLEFSEIGLFGRAGRTGLRLAELQVEDLTSLIKKHESDSTTQLVKIINQLNPKGLIKDVEVQLKPKDEGYFLARANVESASIEPIFGVPELTNVNAYVEAGMFGGHAYVESTDGFTIHLPKVFDERFNLDKVKGELAWRIDTDARMSYLESSEIIGFQGDKSVRGAFGLALPFTREDGEQQLSLVMDIDRAKVEEYSTYLPNNAPADLTDWLATALIDGDVRDVRILYNGSVQRDPLHKPSYQVAMNYQNMEFKFDPQWPSIEEAEGYFLLNSNHVSGFVNSGRSYKNKISQVKFKTQRFDGDFGVSIQSRVTGATNDGVRFISNSPIKEITDAFLPFWTLAGSYSAEVSVEVPFNNIREGVDYLVNVKLADNDLTLDTLNLPLNDIDGEFSYSKEKGLNADSIEYSLWGKPFKSAITSANPSRDIVVTLDGELNTFEFKEWAKRPELIYLNGDTFLDGTLKIPTSNSSSLKGVTLELASSLEGVNVDLPPPFKKNSDDVLTSPAKFNIVLGEYGTAYRLAYKDSLAVDMWMVDEVLPRVSVSVGNQAIGAAPSDASRSTMQKLMQELPGTVNISGSLATANYQDWSAAIERYIERSAAQSVEEEPAATVSVKTDIDIASLDFFEENIAQVNLAASNLSNGSWQVVADSKMVAGTVLIPEKDDIISVYLDHLVLNSEEPTEADPATSDQEIVSKLSNIDLGNIGKFDVVIDALSIANVDWGAWSFNTIPTEGGLIFDNLKANVRELNIGQATPSRFIWTINEGQHLSQFVGSIETADIGKALEAWEFEKLMESKSAAFDLDVSWAAEPDLVNLALLNGDVSFALSNGSFLSAVEAGENPLLRLMALFNFDKIARRLRLDFSDLAAKGFAFDEVRSQMLFDEGKAYIQEPLIVESSSSKMQMVGDIDLVKEQVDAELVVTLPVAGNLAVAAAFAAGLPAGLGVYIISKMFDKQVDKASSISYSIDGDWDDPKVKVRKVFENKTKRKPKKEQASSEDPSMEQANAGSDRKQLVEEQ